MRESDFAFANQVRAAAELRTPRTSRMLLAAVILLLIAGTTWAHFAILDEVKRGQGRVIPSRQMQVLQSLEGGLVEDDDPLHSFVDDGQSLDRVQPRCRGVVAPSHAGRSAALADRSAACHNPCA